MTRLALVPMLLLLSAAAPGAQATVDVDVDQLRNTLGVVHVCMTRNPKHFPDCRGDPQALRQTARASDAHLRFSGLQPGRYAVTLFHDENANQKLDKLMGIPREGFGFSRNPVIRFGPPKFSAVDIEVGEGITHTRVRVQYLL